MQQLYLTGRHASSIADRLFTALDVRPAGFRLLPFSVSGAVRGEVLHLLLPPSPPLMNDGPCRIRIAEDAWATVPRVLEETAAPCLERMTHYHAPILLDALSADLLSSPALRTALVRCLMSARPVIAVVHEDARPLLEALTPREHQLWLNVPEDADARAALLETLLTEAAMRL